MKIRSGFVSNSSSSSFCIFGYETGLSEDDIPEELLNKYEFESGLVETVGVIGISADDLPFDKTLNEIAESMKQDFVPHFKDCYISFITDGGYNG